VITTALRGTRATGGQGVTFALRRSGAAESIAAIGSETRGAAVADEGPDEHSQGKPIIYGPDGKPLPSTRRQRRTQGYLNQVGGFASHFKDAGVMLTIAGILLYAALRSVYVLFYGRLGVQPEEVGLGYTEVLAQSVVGIMLVAAIQAAAFGGLYLAGRMLIAPSLAAGIVIQRRLRPPVLVILLAGAVAFAAFFAWVLTRPVSELLVVPLELLLLVLFAGMVWAHRLSETDSDRDSSRIGAWRAGHMHARRMLGVIGEGVGGWLAAAVVLFAVCVLVVFESLFIRTPFDASEVKRGLSRGGMRIRFLGFPVLTNRGEQARVWFKSDVPPWLVQDCLMYLGQASGTTVFYAVRSKRVVRLPSGDIGLALHEGFDECPVQRHLGQRIRLHGQEYENVAWIRLTGAVHTQKRVRVGLRIQNAGHNAMDEAIASDISVFDQHGKPLVVVASQPTATHRVHLPAGRIWRGEVLFERSPHSIAQLVEVGLADGRASDRAQWDLTIPAAANARGS
jgi:hypothetical protein